MTATSGVLGASLGPLVETAAYDTVLLRAEGVLPDPVHRKPFSTGWTGLGYRAFGAAEHIAAFRGLFGNEPAASPEERRQQDGHFFGFVTNASAAAENLLYAAHVLAWGFENQPPTEAALRAQRNQILPKLEGTPATAALGRGLRAKLDEDVATELFAMRDFVVHRGRLARHHTVQLGLGNDKGRVTIARNPKDLPSAWVNDFDFTAAAMDPWEAWLRDFIALGHKLLLEALPAPAAASAG
jgi:hypothetical protein